MARRRKPTPDPDSAIDDNDGVVRPPTAEPMRKVLLSISLVASIAVTQRVSFAQSEREHALINNFLFAAQKRDYATLAKLTEPFKLEEAQLKGENPRSLWPSLLAGFWKQKTEDLQHKELKLTSLPGDHPFFDEGDDETIHEARELVELMPASAKWSVTEVRPRPRPPTSSVYFLDVYVAVSYPSKDVAPSIGGQALKKAILDCTVTGPPLDSVIACDRFEKGDVYWPEKQ
jgi:hypothetical protein